MGGKKSIKKRTSNTVKKVVHQDVRKVVVPTAKAEDTAPPSPAKPTATPSVFTRTASRWRRRLQGLFTISLLHYIYAWLAFGVLTVTTSYWSLLGARVQQGNADQLADSYLFENAHTFQQATFPGAHTFLLKWPLFFITQLFHFSPNVLTAVTVSLTLTTVAAFAFILYRIERRPLVIGTLFLAMASVLILVPAQPYPGGILPVNMAMITTRNIEYIWYMAALILLVRARHIRSKQFVAAVAVLSVLVASDKLFFDLSIGGSLLALIAYSVRRRWKLVNLSARWVAASALAFAAAGVLLTLIQAFKVTHISGQSAINPYGTPNEFKTFMLGGIYAGFGLLDNFGANPALHIAILRDVPRQVVQGLASLGAVGFMTNIGVLVAGLYATVRVMLPSLSLRVFRPKQTSKKSPLDDPAYFSILLIWTTIAGFGIFIGSDHYYPVDARYLSIALFAAFCAAAVYCRKFSWSPRFIAVVGSLLAVAICCGLSPLRHSYNADIAAVAATSQRNTAVTQILKQHPVSILVGDYWRVLPIRFNSGSKQRVMPLASCTQPQTALSSTDWQPDLRTHSFAYLLTTDASLTGYAPCSLAQVLAAFGHPNASALISGTLNKPSELLLFYDKGGHGASAPATTPTASEETPTVVPISAEQLPYVSCATSTTMNIVAHEDDDILFMNPDLIHAIKAGNCIRTIYVTAGDAGAGQGFWLSREKGSETAYATELGTNAVWVSRIVQLSDHEFVTVANPRGNSKISLIFMHLPDGNVFGEGFSGSHYQTLAGLYTGSLGVIQSVDSQSHYTKTELTSALAKLMRLYQPAEIRTQSTQTNRLAPEHSDHRAVGSFATQAYQAYVEQEFESREAVPIRYYAGYPIRTLPQNIFDADLAEKERMFYGYAAYDRSVCQPEHNECDSRANNYSAYLRRQYVTDN